MYLRAAYHPPGGTSITGPPRGRAATGDLRASRRPGLPSEGQRGDAADGRGVRGAKPTGLGVRGLSPGSIQPGMKAGRQWLQEEHESWFALTRAASIGNLALRAREA